MALDIQHALSMRHIAVCGLCPALQLFSTLCHKLHDFRKKVTGHKMCVLIFCTTLAETFLILRRNDPDMIKMYIVFMLSTHYSCQILMKLEYSRRFLKNTQYQIS